MFQIVLVTLLLTLVNATQKKGFGLCGAAYKCGDTHALSDTSWWYNWHNDMSEYHNHHCSTPPRGEFVPMIWGEKNLYNSHIPDHTTHILGFNEPNAKNQANLSPEKAAQLWHQIEKLAGSRLIVGPGLTSCDVNINWCTDWYDRFFKACPHCRVNKLSVHAYHCDPYHIMKMLETISKRYGRKVWLTEFACETSHSTDEDIRFMQTIIPLLEKADYVERYAWFCSRLKGDNKNHNWNLLDMNSPSLNRLGKVYNSVH